MSWGDVKKAREQKRQATLAAKRAKREAASFRARMADYFYAQSAVEAPVSGAGNAGGTPATTTDPKEVAS